MTTKLSIEPITPSIGAYVRIAPERVLDDGVPGQILAALNTYNVLVFPEINMSDDQFAAMTQALGDKHDLAATDDGTATSNKGIYRIALDKDDKTQLEYVRGNNFWHMDGTFYDVPGKGTLLKCETPPRNGGGETEFANLFAAYDALAPEQKRRLQGLRARHCFAAVGRRLYDQPSADDFARWDAIFPLKEQPLVWRHKDGRTSLVIGATAEDIVGMDHDEGAALLSELVDWCTQPAFTYLHTWKRGDIVIFNNPALLHRSRPYNEASGRLMHRTTLKGVEAIAS